MGIRDIKVGNIPQDVRNYLRDINARAIMVSNYPYDRKNVVRATIKIASHILGSKEFRAIAGQDILEKPPVILEKLGFRKMIFPAIKSESGTHYLDDDVKAAVNAHLDKKNTVLWQSATGRTRWNGLGEEDVQIGAAIASAIHQVPIIPLGYITKKNHGKEKIIITTAGSLIEPPVLTQPMTRRQRTDELIGHSLYVMFKIAELLPPGQRGGFEDLKKWRNVFESDTQE